MPAWVPSVSQHFMWSAIAVLAYVVSSRVRRERRVPTAAIAWVMGLALLPYVMLPLYLLFGWRKQKATAHPPRLQANEQTHWATALLDSFGLLPPAPAQVRFHADGAESLEALRQQLASARQQLDVSMFLIGNDAVGHEALEHLTRQARNGIQVRLLLDGYGAWTAPRRQLRALKAAGGTVALFSPLFGRRSLGARNLRNHRKLVIADGARLWAGGRNLAVEYFAEHAGAPPWIDLTFDVKGAVAAAAALQFEADWAAARGEPPQPAIAAAGVDCGDFAQFLPSGPDQTEDTAEALLIDACYRVQRRLLAVTPYFIPDDALRMALRLAARRGARITLLIPAVSNHRLADFVRSRALRELTDAGAEIRLIPQMVHAKAVVIDDTLGLCGSINLDRRSLLLNYESAVLFYGAAEITWLARWIEALAIGGTPFVAQRPGLLRDVIEGLLLTIAFQL
ncbi:MAG TPA: phospholipase D-like domain-containing protein [Steroidobacteraceae bacterium]|nr:phospholipase D-like domain-containing protein [Steroidobacteraceae bacterium]